MLNKIQYRMSKFDISLTAISQNAWHFRDRILITIYLNVCRIIVFLYKYFMVWGAPVSSSFCLVLLYNFSTDSDKRW